MIFGILLIIEPLIGAVVLTIWIGATRWCSASSSHLAFQLHAKKEEREHKAAAPAGAAAKKA